MRKPLLLCASLLVLYCSARTEETAPNTWTWVSDEKTGGTIGSIVYSPDAQGMILYGYPAKGSRGEVRLFSPAKGTWEELMPAGPHQERGSFFTVWKDGRPRLPCINREYWLAQQVCYLPNEKKALFFAGGSTFYFDPGTKTWEDLKIPLQDAPPDVMLGSMAWDPVKQRAILFGGGYISANKAASDPKAVPPGKPWTRADWTMDVKRATWAFDPKTKRWSRLATGSERFRALHARAWVLFDRAACDLLGAIRPVALEYADTIGAAKPGAVATQAARMAETLAALNKELAAAEGCSDAYEATQCKDAAAEGELARAGLLEAKAALEAGDGWKALWAAEKARWDLFACSECVAPAPLPRYYAAFSTDARNKVLVLFGGHGGDKVLGDTWVFDPAKDQWRRSRAAAHPPAQEMPAMSFDERAGVSVLPSGWLYDAGADAWKTVTIAGSKPFAPWTSLAYDPASGEHILFTAEHGTFGEFGPCRVARLKLDATKAAPATSGGATWHWLNPKYEQSWAKLPKTQAEYRERVAAQKKFLDELPANTWVKRNAPYDCQDRSYGSFCFDTDRNQVVNWGGGHSAYMGNEVSQYDVRSNLWMESWAPDQPPWPFGAPDGDGWNPAMNHQMGAAHGYHKYAYNADLKRVVFVGPNLIYNSDRMRYDDEPIVRQGPGVAGGIVEMGGAKGCLSASAVHYYGGPFGLWKADDSGRVMSRLAGSEPTFTSNDRAKAVYDAKRRRVLWYGVKSGANNACDELWACPVDTGKWEKLAYTVEPAGAKPPPMSAWGNCYAEKYDALMILPGNKGNGLWMYNCATNVMRRLGDEPKVAQTTSGIVYNAKDDVFIALEAGSYGMGPVSLHYFRYKP